MKRGGIHRLCVYRCVFGKYSERLLVGIDVACYISELSTLNLTTMLRTHIRLILKPIAESHICQPRAMPECPIHDCLDGRGYFNAL
jgi:hypothetical protein